MKWSKLKQRIEEGFADKVRGRVEVWSTSYRNAHDQAGEGWITLDGERLYSAATLTYYKQLRDSGRDLLAKRGNPDFRDPERAPLYYRTWKQVEEDLHRTGSFAQWDFNAALFDYLNLSITQIASSDNPLIRAIGMMDRRLGKRQLLRIDASQMPEIARLLYTVRCDLEQIAPTPFDNTTDRPGL